MSLSINQSYAKIGIETTRARVEMQTTQPRLELTQKHARITIHTERPKIQIDQSEAFASAGLKGNVEFTREAAELGYRQALEYVGKVAEDGDMLAAIESGGNPLAYIAGRDAFPEKEFTFGSIPSVGPRISATDGYVRIDPGESLGTMNGVEGNYTAGKIDANYIPGNVNIYLAQKNFIEMKYEPKLDLHI